VSHVVIPRSLDETVAASQARSKAQEIIDANRERVESLSSSGRRELVRILLRAQAQIAEQLASERVRRGDTPWTQADLEASMVLVRHALGGISPRFKDLLEQLGADARNAGCKGVAGLLTQFERLAGGGRVEGGVIRPLAIREALALGHPLLARYPTSVDRYGARMTAVIRRELQTGIVRGSTFYEMTNALVGKRGPRGVVSMRAYANGREVVRTREEEIREGLFVRYRGWAERIVRTEGMYAMNTGADEEILAQKAGRFPDLARKLIETFDQRTARDSYEAHGQVREPGEMFHDGAGRRYERPPGRPNDRAVIIPWRRAWAE